MYVGFLSDFFYKGKSWITNQPKITNHKKYHFILMGGKIFKLDICSGRFSELNNKSFNVKNALKEKNINDDIKNKKDKINIKLSLNKTNKKIISPKTNKRSNQSLYSKIQKNLSDKRSKSSKSSNNNKKLNFSFSPHNLKNHKEKIIFLFLNNKYKLTRNNKTIKNKETIEKYNFKTKAINNNNNRNNYKSYNYPFLKIKKSIDFDNDIFYREDLYDINKEDNELIKSVKNQIFKDKMFKILKKKYSFYKDNKNNSTNIPQIKLESARKIYFDKKINKCKNIFFNKTFRNRNKSFNGNKS